MDPLDWKHLAMLYECLLETSNILEFSVEDIVNVFYCGKAAKWGISNTILIVIKDDLTNRFCEEMQTSNGAAGAAYLDNYVNKKIGVWSPPNKPYQFKYRVLFESAFNGVSSYHIIFDNDWVYDNEPYKNGLCILEEMQKLDELMAFI